MISAIDRRLKKIEVQLGVEAYDFSQWSDAELDAIIILQLNEMVLKAGSLEAAAEAYWAEGHDAAFILREYTWDPVSKTVCLK